MKKLRSVSVQLAAYILEPEKHVLQEEESGEAQEESEEA